MKAYVKIPLTAHIGFKHCVPFTGCVLASTEKEETASKDTLLRVRDRATLSVRDLTLSLTQLRVQLTWESTCGQGQTNHTDSYVAKDQEYSRATFSPYHPSHTVTTPLPLSMSSPSYHDDFPLLAAATSPVPVTSAVVPNPNEQCPPPRSPPFFHGTCEYPGVLCFLYHLKKIYFLKYLIN